MSAGATVTLRLNAGDETRIMADTADGQCLPLCDIKCGGMTGRTVAEGEAIAAGIVTAWNTRATAAEFAAREAALVEALRNLSDRWFLNGGELTAPAYVEAKALIARARTTSEGDG